MGFYDTDDGVEQYIQLADGYDGKELVDYLTTHLSKGARVLELGMGPGKDLDLLLEHYDATGSDGSELFLERYRRTHPNAKLLQLDAVTLNTDGKDSAGSNAELRFDAVYSNKVLHHLTPAELARSFERQAELLNDGGLLLHSFWRGTGEEEIAGMRFVYHEEASLRAAMPQSIELVELTTYQEMEPEDSLRVLLRKRAD